MHPRFPVAVELSRDRLAVVGVMHRKSDEERIDFFLTYRLDGEVPRNAEPQKCSELIWAKLSALPSDMIPYVRDALEAFPGNRWFREFGWVPR